MLKSLERRIASQALWSLLPKWLSISSKTLVVAKSCSSVDVFASRIVSGRSLTVRAQVSDLSARVSFHGDWLRISLVSNVLT